jgi:hypothetical protein
MSELRPVQMQLLEICEPDSTYQQNLIANNMTSATREWKGGSPFLFALHFLISMAKIRKATVAIACQYQY